MAYPQDRTTRRTTFDRIAASYTAGRPHYPDALIAELIDLSSIGQGTSVLEIGPGTGQLTLPLSATGAAIVAVELGSDLASALQDRLSGQHDVQVVVADFDTWTPEHAFDVAVAATSFHWLDPNTRLARCRAALKASGRLAVIETRWGVKFGPADPFFDRSQACYQRWDPDHDPSCCQQAAADVPTRIAEIVRSGLFGSIEHRRHFVPRTYSRSQFLDHLRTYSNIQSWPEDRRAGFLDCMDRMIEEEFSGSVTRCDLYDLCVATAAASPENLS